MESKKVVVIGLGVVGLVSALRLCEKGYHVVGIDKSTFLKNYLLLKGRLPFQGHDLEEVLQKHLHKKFHIGHDEDINAGDIIVICVGTPSEEKANLSNLDNVIDKIKNGPPRPIVIRCTVPPGTMEFYSKQKLPSWPIVYYPEFLRQRYAWKDGTKPSLNIYATLGTQKNWDWFEHLFKGEPPSGTLHKVHIRTAEYIKYINNSFHALKVSFANEIGTLGSKLGVDMDECLKWFTSDRTLNISEKYLRPGLPFGGACLGKDLTALMAIMKENEISAPLIESITLSNVHHYQRILNRLEDGPAHTCGFVRLNLKRWSDMRTDPVFNLGQQMQKCYAWEPEIDKLDNTSELLTSIQRVDSLDDLLKLSKTLIVTTSEKDPVLWDKISSSTGEVFIFEKNQVPCEYWEKRTFHILTENIGGIGGTGGLLS